MGTMYEKIKGEENGEVERREEGKDTKEIKKRKK
jgi:hypothetical protein